MEKLGSHFLIEKRDEEIAPDVKWKMAPQSLSFDIIVDIPNGFIQYSTGCTCHMENYAYAIFTTKKGDVFLSQSSRELKFYKYKSDGTWTDETKSIVPEVNLHSYIKTSFFQSKPKINSDLLKHTAIFYKVPRYGTTITASISLYSIHENNPELYEKAEKEIAKLKPDFEKTFNYKKINLSWDDKKGKLILGEKFI